MIAILSHKRLNVSESELFRAILNWAHIDGVATDRRKLLIKPLLAHIDFAQMNLIQISEHVEPTKILSSDTLLELFRGIAAKVPVVKETRLQKVGFLTSRVPLLFIADL
jgi:hypothetical protein